MPTILNNACINRVPKVKKVKFTSNDLTAMLVTPYSLLLMKEGVISRTPFFAILFSDSNNDYTGVIKLSIPYGNLPYFCSYNDATSNLLRLDTTYGVSDEILYCNVSPDFNVGIIRPDVELHLYYFEEPVSVDFSFFDNE